MTFNLNGTLHEQVSFEKEFLRSVFGSIYLFNLTCVITFHGFHNISLHIISIGFGMEQMINFESRY